MLASLDDFRDAVGHIDITCAIVMIPFWIHLEELFAFPIDGDILAVLFECAEEMLGVLLSNMFYTKVVCTQSKGNRAVCV